MAEPTDEALQKIGLDAYFEARKDMREAAANRALYSAGLAAGRADQEIENSRIMACVNRAMAALSDVFDHAPPSKPEDGASPKPLDALNGRAG